MQPKIMSIFTATPMGSGRLAHPGMYAAVLAMSLLFLTLYLVVDGLEKQICPCLQLS
jgi:hypothetical protein